jgi:hypothetical protein
MISSPASAYSAACNNAKHFSTFDASLASGSALAEVVLGEAHVLVEGFGQAPFPDLLDCFWLAFGPGAG